MPEGDYMGRLGAALDQFETALHVRYLQSVYQAVIEFRLNHMTSAVIEHVDTRTNYDGCAYVNWFAGGRKGRVQDVVCEGKAGIVEDLTGMGPPLPSRIDCPIGGLFAATEEWAWSDRLRVFDIVPSFAHQDLAVFREARDALVEMADDFLGSADSAGLALIANGLSRLISQRASIVNYNREHSIALIMGAARALKAMGERFAGEPGKIAGGLYDEMSDMDRRLVEAEKLYDEDVRAFRDGLKRGDLAGSETCSTMLA